MSKAKRGLTCLIQLRISTQVRRLQLLAYFVTTFNISSLKPSMTELDSRSKWIAAGTCRSRELIDLVEGKIELTKFDKDP